MPDGFQNRVLVLGTLHLAGRKDFTPAHLDTLVKKLSDWNPTQICVESRHPEEIHQMTEMESLDKGVKHILDKFDRYRVELSKIENKRFKYSFYKARALLEAELSRENVDSAKVIKLSLITYDFSNAALYWSKLTREQRKAVKISKRSKEKLDNWMESSGEINSLAIRLAKEKNLKRICSIDSQISAAKVMTADDKEIETLFSSPKIKEFREGAYSQKLKEVREKAFKSGDLMPAYVYLNDSKTNYVDERQWEWLYEDSTNTGLNRVRFISWDRRNAEIASNIIEASQSRKKERVLVIIGASHKSIVERMLRATNSIVVEESFF